MPQFKLRTKFLGITIGIILVMSSVIIILVWTNLKNHLTAETLKRGEVIAHDMVKESIDPLLTQNIYTLQTVVNDHVEAHDDVGYIFITDPEGEVLVHSFYGDFPAAFRKLGFLEEFKRYTVKSFESETGLYFNIIMPVLDGGAGIIHVGVIAEPIKLTANKVTAVLILIISVISLVGCILAVIFVRIITSPIIKLTHLAEQVGKGDLQQKADEIPGDEIGELAISFNRMAASLAEDNGKRVKAENALRESEAKYRNLFEESRDAIYISSWEGGFVDVNQAMIELFGYNREEMLGLEVVDIYLNPSERNDFQQDIERNGSVKDYEKKFIRKDGTSIDCLVTATLRHDGNGTILGYQGAIRDITQQKSLESQLLHSQKMEAVGALAGGIAHDFNNILTSILGYSELSLKVLPENHPIREKIETIYLAGEKAANLTRQLLAFSRKQKMEMKVVNLSSIVEDLGKMLKRMIGDDVELEIISTESTGNILADVSQVEQILMNLAVNARDAMANGGSLTIETKEAFLDEQYVQNHSGVETGPYAMMIVRDSGKGMSQEDQERIFEPFFTTKEIGKGTGLGLSTVYGIVKQHNGHIYVYSELGTGTVFKIFFPVVDQPLNENKLQEMIIMSSGTETILVVDDDAPVRRMVIDTLEPLGYTLMEADSGPEALELCRDTNKKIDLLLSDVIMLGMNGIELIEILKRERPEMKTVLMSGYTDDILAKHGVPENSVTLLNKPLFPGALAHRIRVLLDEK